MSPEARIVLDRQLERDLSLVRFELYTQQALTLLYQKDCVASVDTCS